MNPFISNSLVGIGKAYFFYFLVVAECQIGYNMVIINEYLVNKIVNEFLLIAFV